MKNNRLIRVLLAALLAIGTAAGSFAQAAPQAAPQKDTGLVRLNRAPVSNEVVRVHIPKPVKATLNNGMRVLILEDHRFPTVTTQLVIDGAGGLFDPADQTGLASITAQLMRQGTATRTSKQLAEQIEGLGAAISVGSGGSGSTEATLSASGLSDNFDQWFELAADVLLHPSFPKDELDQLKQRTAVDIRQQRSNPSFLAGERFWQVVYQGHPASAYYPSETSIAGITPDAIAGFYHARYLPQNSILVIAGDVRAADLTPKLAKIFAEWKNTDAKVALPPNPAPQTARHIMLVDRPGSVQTNLLLGNLAIDRRDPDYVPLQVMNDILGGSAAARLFMNLREDKGYTYGAYSRIQAAQYMGTVVANSEVRSDVTAPALTEFFNEFNRIANTPAPAEELMKSKRSMVASFALSLERPAQIVNYALTSERYGFADDYWDKYPDQIMAVTAADVQRVAKKYLNPEAVQIVAVGDAGKVKAMLAPWGSVAVFDATGKAIADQPAAVKAQ